MVYRVGTTLRCVFFITLLGQTLSAETPDLKELIEGWRQLDEANSRLSCKLDICRIERASKKEVKFAECEIKSDGDSRLLFVYQDGFDGPAGIVRSRGRVINDQYSFEVRQNALNTPWVISKQGASNSEARNALWEQIRITGGVAPFAATAFADGTPLADIVSRKDFLLRRLRSIEFEGVAAITFEFELKAPLNRMLQMTKGVVFCSASSPFRVLSSTMDVVVLGGTKEVRSVTRRLVQRDDSHVAQLITDTDKGYKELSKTRQLILREVPKGEFTLTAFGLPEPSIRRSNSRFLIVTLGTVLLAVGFFLWNKARH